MNNHILVFSGRKNSGKNSAANVLIINELCNLGYDAYVNEFGKIVVKAEFKNDKGESEYKFGVLDLDDQSPTKQKFLEETLYPFIKPYSYADELKKFCINVFGLSYAQCYGSDEDKNSLTKLKWEDMPTIVDAEIKVPPRFSDKLTGHLPGYLSARELLQFFGTNICRKMYSDCWVLATLKKIKDDNPALAIITDCRFDNEVLLSKEIGAKVIKLLRKPIEDNHISETALDPSNFDQTKFDAIIDNSNMTIVEQSEAIMKKLIEWEWYKN
jgi:hypothetical protein